MEVIDRVEEVISTSVLVTQQLNGDVRLSHIAKFLSIVLNEAGANTTQESVYEGMFSDGQTSMLAAQNLTGQVLGAFFPASKKKATKKKVTKQ